MVSTITRRPNADTFARWDAALNRANEKGIRLFQHDATGQWFATSSNGTSMYAVTHYTCECQAALANDPVCLHRALFREACRVDDQEVEAIVSAEPVNETGYTDAELDALLAEPAVPMTFDELERLIEGATVLSVAAGSQQVETVPTERLCSDCLNTGIGRISTGGGLNDYLTVTCHCGRVAA